MPNNEATNALLPLKRILVIDDEENMRHMLSSLLIRFNYQVDTAADGAAGLKMVDSSGYEFVLCDMRMPVMDGMAFLKAIRDRHDAPTIITMSAYGSLDIALESMKLGAYDYISKPFKSDEILLVLRKAEERENLRRENHHLREQLRFVEDRHRFGQMIAQSAAMQRLFTVAAKVADYKTTVLITGESGTGKEMVARGIHYTGCRAKGPWVAVNCGGIPESLLESELFGFRRGAFTGADRDRHGLFQTADGGTLFLDEIGEMPMTLQVKLLRALQEDEVRPIGYDRSVKVDVRVIAATARDLSDAIRRGSFRNDLYYRLNVVPLHVPPLRERPEDIPMLCQLFIARFNQKLNRSVTDIHPGAMESLMRYKWPGNVRELENAIERAVLLSDSSVLQLDQLPLELSSCMQSEPILGDYDGFSLKEAQRIMERRLIVKALEATSGNRTRATELLEISHPSLLSKIKAYGIEQ